jgi:lysyl-tRNA synthetase class 2
MQWQPDGDQQSRLARAALLRATREFFYVRQVLEVETPALSQAANTDPYIDSFKTQGPQQRYLHTSPEYPMKRLLAAGSGDIYQICKVWRDEPASRQHNAEFSMLEYYRLGFDLKQLMQEVESLLLDLVPHLLNDSNYQTYAALFLDKLGFNPHTIPDDDLQRCVNEVVPSFDGSLSRQGALDLLLTHCIERDFPQDRLTFISDYPATQSALAQTSPLTEQPQIKVAKRFEVYVGTLELGNGYQELTSAVANRTVLERELTSREALGLNQVPMDQRFLAAMESGLPECSGVAIGLDRVLMLATGAKELRQILNFSWDNA